MIFWLTITILTLIALSIITVPYWRKKSNTSTLDNNELNILLYKRRLEELEYDLSNDVLDKEQYETALAELKLQLLSDVPADDKDAATSEKKQTQDQKSQWSKQTLIATFMLVPALAVGLYFQLGNKDLATGNVEIIAQQTAPDVEKMVAGLAKRLESDPGNVRGWMMLGRSYAAMNEYDKALSAYEKAYELAPEDADVLTNFAETLGLLQDNQLQGRPLELIMKALQINKSHPRALWLAGHAQLQLGDKDKAVKHWQTLLATLPPEHESAQTIRKFIIQAGGQPEGATNKQASTNATLDAGAQGIKIRVKLAEKFTVSVAKDATVFVFARATKGPKIPLAGVRLSVSDLPVELVLNDSNAMIPGRTISGVAQVIIGARISKSGGPISKPGDLEGYSSVISSAHPETIEVIINQIAR